MAERSAAFRASHVALFVVLLALGACGVRGDAGRGACGLTPAQIGATVDLPDGVFEKGASPFYPEEAPSLRLHVAGFRLGSHEVTNAQFAAFVAATGYVTDAERSSAKNAPDSGGAVFIMPSRPNEAGAWRLVRGANWRTPEGPASSIAERDTFPVVQVSHNDAAAYAAWAGGRLPTEVEWEYAAATGLPDAADTRSGAYDADGKPRANSWQGFFPVMDEGLDGFRGSAPVGCFPPDRLGLYDMIGNVWEWTNTPYDTPHAYTIKGGSFLCAKNFCGRFRPAARQGQDVDFSSNHIGFRIVHERPRTSAPATQ